MFERFGLMKVVGGWVMVVQIEGKLNKREG